MLHCLVEHLIKGVCALEWVNSGFYSELPRTLDTSFLQKKSLINEQQCQNQETAFLSSEHEADQFYSIRASLPMCSNMFILEMASEQGELWFAD